MKRSQAKYCTLQFRRDWCANFWAGKLLLPAEDSILVRVRLLRSENKPCPLQWRAAWGLFPPFASAASVEQLHYRGTSLIRSVLLPGPYGRPMPRALRWSSGGAVSYERGTPVVTAPLLRNRTPLEESRTLRNMNPDSRVAHQRQRSGLGTRRGMHNAVRLSDVSQSFDTMLL